MIVQQMIAVVMILFSAVLTGWTSGDLPFPAILGVLGLLGVRRRFTWDIRPERHFITPLLLLLLAVLFSLHCHYSHVRADQAAAFAWQTIARYFLACVTLILFLRPKKTENFGLRMADCGWKKALGSNPPSTITSPPASIGGRPPQSPVGLPASLGLFHLANVLAAGQVLLLDDQYVAFRLAELLSVTLAILYAALDGHQLRISDGGFRPADSQREPSSLRFATGPWPALLLLLLLAVNLGWIGGSLLYRHVEAINFLPAWLSRGGAVLDGTTTEIARVGFSTSGKLSSILSIKEDLDTAPVLTVTGDSNPIYLRAKTFESYHHSQWHDLKASEAIAAEQSLPFGVRLGRGNVFRLHPDEARREVTIRHESGQSDVLFTPLGTCFVEASFDALQRDDADIVNAGRVRPRQSYRVGYGLPTGARPPTRMQLKQMSAPPPELHPRIRQTANQVFRDCTTTAQKIDAVTRYFHVNYTYSLGLEVPDGQDPLNYFLVEASTGYCEYFASGAAVLLRLAGVPTRYVTGFLVTERGADGRSWIVRNTDAHAWVEAWDGPLEGASGGAGVPEGKWVIVEATTQEGLDDVSLADELVRNAGSGRPFLGELAQALYEYGLFGVLGRLFDWGLRIASWRLAPGAVALAALALGLALRLRRRACSPSELRHPHLGMLHRALARMDRQMGRRGYRRYPDETLHAFADRVTLTEDKKQNAPDGGQRTEDKEPPAGPSVIRRMVEWYRQYAELRYARVVEPARLEQLCQRAQRLP